LFAQKKRMHKRIGRGKETMIDKQRSEDGKESQSGVVDIE